LWRVIQSSEAPRLRWRVRLDNSDAFARHIEERQTGTYGRIARSSGLGAPFEMASDPGAETPTLESHPDLYSCFVAKTYMRWQPDGAGLCRHAFPVMDGREVICILELIRATPLTIEEERLVFGLLRIYRNHLGMLDYSDCDDLTGLLNRRTYDETFRRVAARSAEALEDGPVRQSILAVIDIDHFKRVNDQFGHPYGDEVIVLLARLMSRMFEEPHYTNPP
jgi:hypothetical protein